MTDEKENVEATESKESVDENQEAAENLRRNRLSLASNDPTVLTDEYFKELENIFSAANNMSPCPCGSGKNFKFCCKSLWQHIARSYKSLVKDKDGKVNPNVRWVFRVGVDKRQGIVMETLVRQSSPYDLFEMAAAIYHQMLFKLSTGLTLDKLSKFAQAEDAQNMAAKPGKKKPIVGL